MVILRQFSFIIARLACPLGPVADSCTATLSAQKERPPRGDPSSLLICIHDYAPAFFRFPRRPNRPEAFRPVAESGRVGNSQFETPTYYRNLRGSSPATSLPQKFNVEFREPDSRNCFGQQRSKKDGVVIDVLSSAQSLPNTYVFCRNGKKPKL
jgi:hypothetical protein